MSKWVAFFTGVVALLCSAPNAYADMGQVTISTTGATVNEDAQKAIILHNGKKEVLILGTEIEASRKTPIIRFIPFPSEPKVSLAPKGTFDRLAAIVDKYALQYVYRFQTKGGPAAAQTKGVEVRLDARLGAHDIAVVKVNDVAAFRGWVNGYLRSHHLPPRASYPAAEAVVADYVARGYVYFALDAVDATARSSFVAPIAYTFESKSLYYPLETSNTFAGRREIELFVVAPTTLCYPGTDNIVGSFAHAADTKGHPRGQCLGQKLDASTSAMLVPEEHDLQTLYPGARAFFGKAPVYIQTMRYTGEYKFDTDIVVPMPQGFAGALGVERPEPVSFDPMQRLYGPDMPACREKPARGVCKAMFERYYFDPASHSCKAFIWGGCQGSVPFQTREECRDTCVIAPLK